MPLPKLKRRLISGFVVALALVILTTNCKTTMHQQTVPDATYLNAAKITQPSVARTQLQPGSPEESEAVQRIQALFQNYTPAYLSEHFNEVYAEELYFRDAFKQFDRASDVKRYLLDGLEALNSCSFEFNHVLVQNGEIFLHWTMKVSLKRDKSGTVDESMGISHMRINDEGKVIFHQDFWDPTDVVYRRIPVAGWLIGKVKERL